MPRFSNFVPLAALALACFTASVASVSAERSESGLIALYDFKDTEGDVIKDKSGKGAPLDLRIAGPKSVRRWVGALEVHGATLIRSEKPAGKIVDAVRRSGEFTVEAWVRPARTDQTGPARVVTLSKNGSERNFTLGQDGDKYDVRFRATKTSTNGIPSLSTKAGSLAIKLTHVVYTRDRAGKARIWLDGKLASDGEAGGATSNWNSGYHLALANEHSNDRPWLGTYRLVALYGRALSPAEVAAHFRAGANAGTGKEDAASELAAAKARANAELFQFHVAPLLSRHCVECHDSANRKGELDLSSRSAALASKVVVSGDAGASDLWAAVDENEMPKKRDPLSDEEKALLKSWIDGGAAWPEALVEIDPLAHKRDRRAARNWVRRLTLPEYVATVRSAVGVEIGKEARELLPKDLRADGFSNTSYNLGVDLKHVESYALLAEIIVGKMKPVEFAKRFSEHRKFTEKEMGQLIEGMGKWLLRGPLEEREIIAYRGVAALGGSFEEAVALVIEAMLQSPRFLYLIENQRGDGSRWPVGNYELASRMSYILWGAPPDEELSKAADDARLGKRDEAAKQVARMLEDPRAIARSLQFASEWLNLARLENLSPDKSHFPDWDPALAGDMRDETLAYFEDVVWKQKRPLADLLNAQITYVTPRLAKHYGIPVSNPSGGRIRVDLSKVASRGGLLTQGSALTMGGDEASMVTRGLFILHDLLRGGVKDPPPGTDTTPVPSRPGLSQRMIGEDRIANESCGGCHGKFEPLAFGLERFDGLGAYREVDRFGNMLRDDGTILFPGHSQPTPFANAAEMMDLLAGSERVSENISWKITQFAIGRPLVEADTAIVRKVHEDSLKNGGTYVSLLTALILSDLVQTARTESVAEAD